jgi:hypothetical protein
MARQAKSQERKQRLMGTVCKLILLLLFVPTAAASAEPMDIVNVESKAIYAGPINCDGKERVLSQTLPWEDVPIAITEVHLSVLPQPSTGQWYGFVGDWFGSDPLTPILVSPQTMVARRLAAGTAVLFPPRGTPADNGIDVHLFCLPPTQNIAAWVVIFYVKGRLPQH